jgi:hypothetical protein
VPPRLPGEIVAAICPAACLPCPPTSFEEPCIDK